MKTPHYRQKDVRAASALKQKEYVANGIDKIKADRLQEVLDARHEIRRQESAEIINLNKRRLLKRY